jgi:TPP-dependent 2-oxoacid decarboxylase
MTTNGVVENGSGPTVPLGRYLWERIHQVGVNHVFGVPGDFNLTCKSEVKCDIILCEY